MRRLISTCWLILNWSFYIFLPLWIIPLGIIFLVYAFYRQFTIKLDDFTDDDWYIRDIFINGDRFATQDSDNGFRSKDSWHKVKMERTMKKLLAGKRKPIRIKTI